MASVEEFWRRKDLLLPEWLQVWNKKGVSAILQGTVQGGRRRGRQKKRWESNISEWTGLKFCNALREAENKIKWRERVAMSVAPQRSPYLYESGQKLLLGWLFQFRSFYLTILFCTVCDWWKISGHFLEQPSIKPGNSSVFLQTESKLEGKFSCSSKFLGFLHMAFHPLNSI